MMPTPYGLPLLSNTNPSSWFAKRANPSASPVPSQGDHSRPERRSDIQYEPGRDWILEEGMLVIPKSSRIPVTEKEELEIRQYREGACFPKKGGGYIRFSEGDSFHQKQIAVTYTCEPGQWTGYIPPRQGDHLPRTAKKLAHKQDRTVIIYGDSIAEGYNASGCVGTAPNQPVWGELIARYLIGGVPYRHLLSQPLQGWHGQQVGT